MVGNASERTCLESSDGKLIFRMPVSHFDNEDGNTTNTECQTECDIDSLYTLDGFKNYFDTGIKKFKAEVDETIKNMHSDITDHPLVRRLNAEITFLRTELVRRHQEFCDREATMQTVINILGGEQQQQIKSTRNGQHAHKQHLKPTGGGSSEWKKPRRPAPQPTAHPPQSFVSDNQFSALPTDDDNSESSPLDEQPQNVTFRRGDKRSNQKKKKGAAANVPRDNAAQNSDQQSSRDEQSEPERDSTHPGTAQTSNEPDTYYQAGYRVRRKEVVILGDSLVKNLKGHLMSKRKFRVTNVPISGMKLEEVLDMARGLCCRKPQILFITCGTNSLFPKDGSTAMTPADIVAKLQEVRDTIQREFPETKVIVSTLIVRNDFDNAGEKIDEVNSLIYQSGMEFIDHPNITLEHLNGSKLHLNRSGDIQLSKNFVEFLITLW